MKIPFQFRRLFPFGLVASILLLAASGTVVGAAEPSSEGVMTVKKITGDGTVQVDSRQGGVRTLKTGDQIALPAQIVTGASRVMLTMSERKIAVGQNSSCRISRQGDVRIDKGRRCAVAVQPSGPTVQRIYYFDSGVGAVEEGAVDWGDLEEELEDSEVADIVAEAESFAIAYAPSSTSGGYFRFLLFEGRGAVEVNGAARVGLTPNQLSLVPVDGRSLSEGDLQCADFHLERAVETSALVNDFQDCWDLSAVNEEIARQNREIREGLYVSFRRQKVRRGTPTGIENRSIIRTLKNKLRKRKH